MAMVSQTKLPRRAFKLHNYQKLFIFFALDLQMEPEGGFIAISRFGKQERGVNWGDLLVAPCDCHIRRAKG
ncbi:hypothetical protein HA451_15285 [Aeromonas veronii]|uniref:hypothetical protein n=1 Tax=Aeromonas veronii TaxID=654 RepID=UPI00142F61D4|nr:hypothetical protein [Aeromonas veronii]NJI24398.1 hypothetical protein [Aeromonas veronii]NJI32957.1 hypothetical protein [Aeromonas veronii]